MAIVRLKSELKYNNDSTMFQKNYSKANKRLHLQKTTKP